MTLPWQREPFAPERYELGEAARWSLEFDRRGFLQALGSGLALLVLAPTSRAGTSADGTIDGAGQDREETIAAWLHVGKDGAITAFTGKVEVGQDIRTSLTQAVAEEARVPMSSVALVMGDTDAVPYDRGTFGSRTTPTMARTMRQAAAALREWLVDLAAERLGVARGELTAAAGAVAHADSGRSLGYAEIVGDRALTRRIDAAALRPAGAWQVCGGSPPKVEARALVTGAHRFPSDVVRPGMLHGRVLRPAAFGAKLTSLDDRAAKAMPGVQVVRDGDLVGVVARTAHAAGRALAALQATWTNPPTLVGEQDLFEQLRAAPQRDGDGGRGGGGRRGGRGGDDRGDVDAALRDCKHVVEATFTVPYIAHAPLEPRAAVAEWSDGKLTVWTGTQRPFGVREELMRAFGLVASRVRVLVPDTGSGYGGKHTGDAAVEAAALARAAGGPVAVRWTREEEFTWAYFRPAGTLVVRAGADADGKLVAWEFHNHNSGAAAIEPPYAVANRRVQFHPADSPLRQGSYRALAATANHFARESVIDDLAAKAGVDPLAFRRQNLADDRLRAVLDAAAERAEFGAAPPDGVGRGIACGTDKGGYVATVADVRVDAGRIEVVRLVTAFECGAVVHPDNLRNQIEGALVQGLGGALFEAVRFGQGRIHNPRFQLYRVPRFGDVPELVTLLVDRPDLPSAGAGEAPIVGTAPAIRNALAALTGRRQTALPLQPA